MASRRLRPPTDDLDGLLVDTVGMQVQQSRFTVHSKVRDSIQDIFKDSELMKRRFLFSIDVDKNAAKGILLQLEGVGVSRSTLFPDIEGVARDLSMRLSRLWAT